MNSLNRVPFMDLALQYQSMKFDIDRAISRVILNSSFVRGEEVERFESEFASAMGARFCVSCGNGTDALFIAIKSLGLKAGDEVIVPASSWISTSETVSLAGGAPIFCDIDPATFTIDPTKIADKITNKTVGIIPVHLYGQSADMSSIMPIARANKLWVIEDCAQAHLAKHKDSYVGSFGDIATFSFYPSKNLGAMGDAGALITSNAALADYAARFSRHGGLIKGEHQIEGMNSRLDGMQAAILLAKLPYLNSWTERRRAIAAEYSRRLVDTKDIILPNERRGDVHVWHLYVLRHKKRDLLKDFLANLGIQTLINYPVALPFLPAYARMNCRPDDYPVAYQFQSQILSLPLYPELSQEKISYVSDAIKKFCD